MKYTRADWILAGATGFAVFLTVGTMLLIFGQVFAFGVTQLTPSFLFGRPRDGGILDAIVGTFALTLLMTIAVVPVGVATGIYLSEYAPQKSRLAELVRGAVTNLAGVPSIVFGLFGLGFFVYFVGSGLDTLTGQERLWGQPGILWSSLTLAVLTLPVVIVTTEEALRNVPRELREAALGLGATRFQAIVRVILPHATGGIMTGVILAISRGAGEVAPILFTGAAAEVSRLPTAPQDSFMHLGYHVWYLSTQSPRIDEARPMIYGTVLVLLIVTFALNLSAMVIRARVRPR